MRPPEGGWPSLRRQVLLLSAGGVLADVALHGLQGGGSWLGLGALAGGWIWLARGQAQRLRRQPPHTVAGWRDRCQSLQQQFARLDPDPLAEADRSRTLTTCLEQGDRQDLRLALVSSSPPPAGELPRFQEALRGRRPLQILVSDPLPRSSARWHWNQTFASCDGLIFHVKPPLMAADLRWLEALPGKLPLWILLEVAPHQASQSALAELQSQWPSGDNRRILPWSGQADQLAPSLAPLAQWLAREGDQLPSLTLCRCLEDLHGCWQADLERLRRSEWRALQQRTQWLVAAGVLLTPGLSLDLLVLTVANGLMLREMARLWDCPWSLEQLQAAATEVGKAALLLGVVEWSSQAFSSAFRLHGSTWLVGGALQALSAAHLTRVIGHAMADLLARNAGVSEPDLQAIKAEAALLVAKAAEEERLDWGSFLQEARKWLAQQQAMGKLQAE